MWIPDDGESFELSESVSSGAADLGLRIVWSEDVFFAGHPAAEVEIVRLEDSPHSHDAADFVRQRLEHVNSAVIDVWAKTRNESFDLPIRQTQTLVAAPPAPSAILGVLPLVLLLMTVTGGVYPAIDLTAGERERDTLESLMALPVPPLRLLLAKYVAVLTVTMLTGAMNLLAMSTTVLAMQLETVLFGPSGLTWFLGVKLALVLVVFALFYSSLLLALTSSTRSFKEAQAYLIPLMLLTISPGLLIVMPGWSLNYATAAVPLVNMLLLARDVLEGQSQGTLGPVLVAAVSTGLSVLACLTWAAKVFGSDAVSVGAQGNLKDFMKPPSQKVATPSLQLALAVLALLFPLYFTTSGLLARLGDGPVVFRLIASAELTCVLFAVLPWCIARVAQVRSISGFRLKGVNWTALLGGLLLGLSTWPWVFEAFVAIQSWSSWDLDDSKLDAVERLLVQWRATPLPWIVLTMGVVPGVCEELFFRGFLFSGVRRHFGDIRTVGFTALAFGFFHVVLAGGAAPERIVPSTLMGLLLGWVALRADSIWPAILLHVTHNSLLVTVARYREELPGLGTGLKEARHFPPVWLALAAAGGIAGVALIQAGTGGLLRQPQEQHRAIVSE
jgi:ABC-2 type transport system permease protein/sodium transport system permease protein